MALQSDQDTEALVEESSSASNQASATSRANLTAMAFDPNERFQDARQLGEESAAALAEEPETLDLPVTSDGKQGRSAAILDQKTLPAHRHSVNDAPSKNQDVFISYSSGDKKAAETICEWLEQAGLSCWIAPRNVLPSQTWAEAIISGISKSRVMVLVLSAKANESPQVIREVDRAINNHIPIIPFRVEDVAPSGALGYYLSVAHWLDAYTPPLSKHLKYLESTVRSLIDKSEPYVDRTPRNEPTPRRWWLVAAAIVLIIGIAGAWLWTRRFTDGRVASKDLVASNTTSERVFTYFLTPSDKTGDTEEKRFAGNEQFRNGSKFRFVLIPEQAGALYLLDEGSGATGSVLNVLFPNFRDKNASSVVAANQRLEAGIHFDPFPGKEDLSIIWTTQPIPELETIFKDAAKTDSEIKNPAQIKTIKEFLAKYVTAAPKAEVDNEKKQTTVSGRGEILISKRVLEHINF